jgi:arsenate reductase (thioredoxin)
MNVFVLCTVGSARSILLESLLKLYGASRLRGYAAGLQPGGRVYPRAVLLLFCQNHDTVDLVSKSWDEFAKPDAPVMDLVITVCGGTAQETCPIWPSAAIRAHWGTRIRRQPCRQIGNPPFKVRLTFSVASLGLLRKSRLKSCSRLI